jgi:hypothetical protein
MQDSVEKIWASAQAQLFPDSLAPTFQDVPKNHWAFPDVEELRVTGVLEGYKRGWYGKVYLKGNRAMTRYEFGAALSRFRDKSIVDPPSVQVQALPRTLSLLESLDGEIARIWAESDKHAETAEVSPPKTITSSVSKVLKAK